jgi:hypothetical protein
MNSYESNTMNQSATPFTYENSSTRHGSTSARAWEDGIDEVLLQTNSSIEKLMEMRRPLQDLNSQSSKYSVSGRTSARSTSVPRLSASTPNKEGDGSSVTALEQKLDFMYRRIKMLDDKVKSMEKEKLENRNFSVDTMSAIRHIADAQAADQKQIFLLKDSAVTMRSDVELLNRREREMLVKIEAKAPKLTDVDQERQLMEAVTKVIRIKFKSQIKEAAVMFAADHANRVAKWAEKSTAEIERMRHESQRLEVQAIPVIESELRGVIFELERLKGRQDVVDNSYRSLENTVLSREMKAEEAHKKAMRNYKKEMSAVMDTVGIRMNEQLSLCRSNEGDCGRSNDMSMQRLCVVEAFQKEQSAHHKTRSSSIPIQASNTAAAAAAAAAEEECQAGVAKKSLQNITAQPELEIDKKQSLELVVEKLQSDIRDMKIIHNEYESASTTAIDALTSSNRKIKGKINELSAGMASFSKIREAVESLLVEVHLRTKGDYGPKGDDPVNRDYSPKGDNIINTDYGPKGDDIINTDYGPKGDDIINTDYGPKGDDIINTDYGPKGDLKNALVSIYARLESLEINSLNHETKRSSESQPLILQNEFIAIRRNGSLPSAVQEYIENEMSRLQADLEDAVNTGWVDVTARNNMVAKDTAKLSEEVQLLQSTLVTVQSEQQGLIRRMTTLECNTFNTFNISDRVKDVTLVQELPVEQITQRPPSAQHSTRRKGEKTSVVVTEKAKEEVIEKETKEKTEEKIEIEEEIGVQTEENAEAEAEKQALLTGPTDQNEILALEPLYVRIGLHESSVFAQQSTSSSESSDVVGARVEAVAAAAGSSSASLPLQLPLPSNQPSTPVSATVISVLSPIPVCIDYDSDIDIENDIEVENKIESASNGIPLERILIAEEKPTSKNNGHRSGFLQGVINNDKSY